jgi:hypothetical protein
MVKATLSEETRKYMSRIGSKGARKRTAAQRAHVRRLTAASAKARSQRGFAHKCRVAGIARTTVLARMARGWSEKRALAVKVRR